MLDRLTRTVCVVLLAAAAAAAQPPKMDDVRVITNERLSVVSFLVKQNAHKVFTTDELINRLKMVPPTDSVLVVPAGPGPTDTVWYTDPAATRPRPVTVTRAEHALLSECADGGLSRIIAMFVGPKTVTQEIVTTKPDGTKVVVPVHKTALVVPSEGEVNAAVDDMTKLKDPNVRAAAELVAGARFAELFPPTGFIPAPKAAAALADRYRQAVYADAVKTVGSKTAADLPPLNEPVLFGRSDGNVLAMAKAVEGAKPVATFETDAGKFVCAWHKSALVLVRRPKGEVVAADDRIRLSDSWLQALSPKVRDAAMFDPLRGNTIMEKAGKVDP